MEEIWKPLMYGNLDLTQRIEVSNMGNIRNFKTKKILRLTKNHEGYMSICISLGCRGKLKNIKVHRAVAFMFVEGYKEGLFVNHKDLNKTNNIANNLEWVTNLENIRHAELNKDWSSKSKPIRCIQTGEVFTSIIQAQKWCGLKSDYGIGLVLQGKMKHSGKHPVTDEKLSWELL